MDNITLITGNIFTTRCQTIVNTVNCVGVMGAGLALECRLRNPAMYARYAQACASGELGIGKPLLVSNAAPWILCFPTKKDWKHPSRARYLHQGLNAFVRSYREWGIRSVAFPLLGAQHGGLAPSQSLDLMLAHLQHCEIAVEIYRHDPAAPDDLYQRLKALLAGLDDVQLRQLTGLTNARLQAVRLAMASPRIRQINQLASARGVGEKTLEAVFRLNGAAESAQLVQGNRQGGLF